MGLGGPGWPEGNHVVGFSQKVELVEVRDLLTGDRSLVGEVEVVEGLDLREPGGFDLVFAAVGSTGGDLLEKHLGQETRCNPSPRCGPVSANDEATSRTRGILRALVR